MLVQHLAALPDLTGLAGEHLVDEREELIAERAVGSRQFQDSAVMSKVCRSSSAIWACGKTVSGFIRRSLTTSTHRATRASERHTYLLG